MCVCGILAGLLYVVISFFFFFFKQKTAYEMRISDWSSDVCSSDLDSGLRAHGHDTGGLPHCLLRGRVHPHAAVAPEGPAHGQRVAATPFRRHLVVAVSGEGIEEAVGRAIVGLSGASTGCRSGREQEEDVDVGVTRGPNGRAVWRERVGRA